jgi:hypothetical protein
MARRWLVLNDCELLVRSDLNHITVLQQVAWAYLWTRTNELAVHKGSIRRFPIPHIDVVDGRFVHHSVDFAVVSGDCCVCVIIDRQRATIVVNICGLFTQSATHFERGSRPTLNISRSQIGNNSEIQVRRNHWKVKSESD